MILVTGSVTAREDSFDEVRRLSLEHVRRSRLEQGCLSHAVHMDCENPLRLVFLEQWADPAALGAHFAVPASRDFIRALKSLAADASTTEIFDATRVENL
jgi:quinol monooxygenase YgiN